MHEIVIRLNVSVQHEQEVSKRCSNPHFPSLKALSGKIKRTNEEQKSDNLQIGNEFEHFFVHLLSDVLIVNFPGAV